MGVNKTKDRWRPTVEGRWKAQEVEGFYARGVWKSETLDDIVGRWCEIQPQRVFVSDGYGTLTWEDLRAQAYRMAASLRELGVEAGDRVVVQLPNWCELVVTYLALSRIGAVVAPLMMVYRHDEVAYVSEVTAAKGIVTTTTFRNFDHLAMVRDIRPECPSIQFVCVVRGEAGPGEIAFNDLTRPDESDLLPSADALGPVPSPDDGHVAIFTSGTESRPKGCYHSFNTFRASLDHLIDAIGATEHDVAFMPSPLPHAIGLVFGLGVPLVAGGSTHLLDVWDPEVGLQRIREFSCTTTATATPFVQMALDAFEPARHDLSSLRVWTCGGAPIPSTMVERMAQAWPSCRLVSLYGRSEVFVSTVGSLADPPGWALSSDGHPPPWVELVVRDPEGHPVPTGTDGEITQRGPGAMLGYWNDEARTAEAFDAEGWCRSGDLGRIDDHGCLRVTGRLKDIIIRGGQNISAAEVEDHLLAHPAVRQVAVVSMPDRILGERACAFVVPAGEPPTLAELTEFLRTKRRISMTKLPERLEIIDSLPVTASGKVQKFELRDHIRVLMEKE